MNLRDICRNPEWKPVSTASLKRMNFLPNRVLQNMTALEVAVVLRRSRRGGFGISKPVVDYYDERLRSGKVRQVWVLFVEQDSTVIDWCPMSEVIGAGAHHRCQPRVAGTLLAVSHLAQEETRIVRPKVARVAMTEELMGGHLWDLKSGDDRLCQRL